MEIEVTTCRSCPFCTEEYEQKCCTLIPVWSSEWLDDDGFDELYQKGVHPLSCPLRIGTITVTLKQ